MLHLPGFISVMMYATREKYSNPRVGGGEGERPWVFIVEKNHLGH